MKRILLCAALSFCTTHCSSDPGGDGASVNDTEDGDTGTAPDGTDTSTDADTDTTVEPPDTSGAVRILYADTTVTASGAGVGIDGTTATITSAGTYVVTGASGSGKLRIDAAGADVTVSLEGVVLDAGADMAVYVAAAAHVLLYATPDSVNTFANGAGADVEGAIYSAAALTIAGSGAIAVSAESGGGIVTDGDFTLDEVALDVVAADSALKSNADLTINGGTYVLTAGNDGVHADFALTVRDGDITVTGSEEGMEGASLTITGGTMHLTSTDDGVNGATDDGSPATMHMSGGYVYVNAQGDGVDVNGSITMTGGTIIVDGPTDNDNGALDYDQTFVVSGGTIIAAGSAGMGQAPSTTSTQRSVRITFGPTQSAHQLVRIEDDAGNNVVTFAPAKVYRSLVFSSNLLSSGTTYSVFTGGAVTGEPKDGVYAGTSYTGGSLRATFNPTTSVTNVTAN